MICFLWLRISFCSNFTSEILCAFTTICVLFKSSSAPFLKFSSCWSLAHCWFSISFKRSCSFLSLEILASLSLCSLSLSSISWNYLDFALRIKSTQEFFIHMYMNSPLWNCSKIVCFRFEGVGLPACICELDMWGPAEPSLVQTRMLG